MQYPSPDQPVTVKIINRIGRLLSALGLCVPSLAVDKLIGLAIKRTELTDFGNNSFRAGLEKLVQSLESEAQLSLMGRIAARGQLVNVLCARLQLVNYRKLRPEVASEKIKRPIFVLGLPRTGTTILYELLAQDPAHRAPLCWEIEDPIPPARIETYESDPRIEVVDKQLAQTELLAPGFNAIHEIGARLPQECLSMMASQFISEQYSSTFNIPSYRAWMLEQDMSETLDWHYQFLQHMQLDFPVSRWVLKSPAHLAYLDSIAQRYPDAVFVQTHRSPMDVIGSVTSLACTLHGGFSDDIDPIGEGNAQVEFFSEILNRGMAQREAMADREKRFYDIDFAQIISDPITAIEKMYRHFDFEFTDEARAAMQQYLDNRPRDKHGRHHYTLEQFGLSQARHGPKFDSYCQRFGL